MLEKNSRVVSCNLMACNVMASNVMSCDVITPKIMAYKVMACNVMACDVKTWILEEFSKAAMAAPWPSRGLHHFGLVNSFSLQTNEQVEDAIAS